MGRSATRHAIIIGGGASGVLLAYQLLRNRNSGFRVTLSERRTGIGHGLEYHTDNPEHMLNVRLANNMSAIPDDPDHFWRWLTARKTDAPLCPDPFCFLPRRTYGDYLASLIEPLTSNTDGLHGLSTVQGECIEVREHSAGVTATLANGVCYAGDVAILATGHETPISSLFLQANPWAPPSAAGIDKGAPILILGTGLTMVDYVLSLLHDGY